MPKIRASFRIFGVPLCLLDHAFGPRVGSARPARSQDAAASAAITKADSVGWRLYGKTPGKIGFAPSVKSACSERSSIVASISGGSNETCRPLPAGFHHRPDHGQPGARAARGGQPHGL